jgi:hypothetical protein
VSITLSKCETNASGPRVAVRQYSVITMMGTEPAVAPGLPKETLALDPGLERECRSYARYLIGQAPNQYVIDKYLDFHQKFGARQRIQRFDLFLLRVSARGPFCARLADSYASIWRKDSVLRKKVVLTLALLECAPPTFETLDHVPAGGWIGAVLRLGMGATGYALTVLMAAAFFMPARLWMAVRES